MSNVPEAPHKLGVADYVIAVLCLFPILGLLVALPALILGLIKIRRGGWLLILMAFLGAGVTVGSCYWAYYQMFEDKDNAIARAQARQVPGQLAGVVQALENFKSEKGHYPADLKELPREVETLDMLASRGKWHDFQRFFYEPLPDGMTYYLFSKGFDNAAFTADDIQPQLSEDLAAHAGWRSSPQSLSSLQSSPIPGTTVAPEPSVAFWRSPSDGMVEAKSTGKLLLYDFSAEWCGPCRRLNDEVFENPAFKAQILEKFVPVHVVDRRREEGRNPQEIEGLQQKYAIRAFPTLIIRAPSGDDFRRQEGYGNADSFITFLDKSANDLRGR
ncbi:MAG TPA: thioredoxin fold domain-containing protein [bacterium]|nr:thioredoxin fold domain-containing protein [bacterium]